MVNIFLMKTRVFNDIISKELLFFLNFTSNFGASGMKMVSFNELKQNYLSIMGKKI